MSTLKVNTIKDTNGVEVYTAKAWVNFDGTFGTSPFTVANGGIRAAGNVSSVTDNGTGDYTVNFTTAMTDANYSFTVGYVPDGIYLGSAYARIFQTQTVSASSIRVLSLGQSPTGSGVIDYPYLSIAIFR